MKDFHIYAHFPASYIADRFVNAISEAPIRTQAALIQAKKLRPQKSDGPLQILSYRNLVWQNMDDYALACNKSLRYFIFGDEEPDVNAYSPYGREFIALLQVFPGDMRDAVIKIIDTVYANPKFAISPSDTPSAKLIAIQLIAGKLPKLVPEEQLHLYSTAINEELLRFRQARQKERMIFHLNYILDLCRYYKVSPHWVFSLNGPLLCPTAEEDAFFDKVCLLDKQQQVVVLATMVALCPDVRQQLSEEVWQRIEHILSTEGGVV